MSRNIEILQKSKWPEILEAHGAGKRAHHLARHMLCCGGRDARLLNGPVVLTHEML
jgi:hypothetical protein